MCVCVYVILLVKLEPIIVYVILTNNLSHSLQLLSSYFQFFPKLKATAWLVSGFTRVGYVGDNPRLIDKCAGGRRQAFCTQLADLSGIDSMLSGKLTFYILICSVENTNIFFFSLLDSSNDRKSNNFFRFEIEQAVVVKIISKRIRICHLSQFHGCWWLVSLRHQ